MDKTINKLEKDGNMLGNPSEYLKEIFIELEKIRTRLDKLEDGIKRI